MNVSITNWLADNSVRKYPLDDLASGVAGDGRELPLDFITDLKLSIENRITLPYISGLFVNANLISITISGQAGPLLLGTFYRPTLEAYVPYQLSEVTGSRAAGTIIFGPGALTSSIGNYLFDTDSGALSPHSYILRGAEYVKSIRSESSQEAVTGEAAVRGVNGATAAITGSTLAIGLSDQALADLGVSVGCNAPAITSINNVVPDSQGRIFLRFK